MGAFAVGPPAGRIRDYLPNKYVGDRRGYPSDDTQLTDTKDNDTIAAIVGAALGALHGRRGIPQRWLVDLSGRTTDRDDGRIFTLLDQARSVFG